MTANPIKTVGREKSDSLTRLTQMGFIECGEWTAEDGRLTVRLSKFAETPNVLYAFVVNDEVEYIGKTVRCLEDRMRNYCIPHKTQLTNTRNNSSILEALHIGKRVTIFVLPDNGFLYYGGFHVNLAAGLEDALVRELNPPWNGGKKDSGGMPVVAS